MSTTFLGHTMAVPAPAVASESDSFWRRLAANFARHQEEKAARFVRPYLQALTDADLAVLGHSPAQIAEIRETPAEIDVRL